MLKSYWMIAEPLEASIDSFDTWTDLVQGGKTPRYASPSKSGGAFGILIFTSK
jgi:hypothetical protein